MTKLIHGTIYSSVNHGEFRVISDDGRYAVGIEFVDTSYRNTVRRQSVRSGKVKDPLASSPNALKVGTVLQSENYGKFKVVRDDNWRSVCIEFIETGYRYIVYRRSANLGKVKDRLVPSVYGVGFIGAAGKINRQAHNAWTAMLGRCYSHKYHQRRPTYADCTVTPEWHNFQNFAIWYEENHKPGLHLDKDIKITGNRVYGPDTCTFVTQLENSVEACAKHYTFLSPDGIKHQVYNLNQFAKDQGLHRSNMTLVHSGKQSHHHGWVKV